MPCKAHGIGSDHCAAWRFGAFEAPARGVFLEVGAESIERPEDVLVEIEVPPHAAEGDLLSVSLPDGCCKPMKVPQALVEVSFRWLSGCRWLQAATELQCGWRAECGLASTPEFPGAGHMSRAVNSQQRGCHVLREHRKARRLSLMEAGRLSKTRR